MALSAIFCPPRQQRGALCAAMPHNVTITGLRTEDIVGIHTYSRDERLEVIDARYLTRLPKLTPPENKEPNKE